MQLNLTDVLHFVDKSWNIRKEFMYNQRLYDKKM